MLSTARLIFQLFQNVFTLMEIVGSNYCFFSGLYNGILLELLSTRVPGNLSDSGFDYAAPTGRGCGFWSFSTAIFSRAYGAAGSFKNDNGLSRGRDCHVAPFRRKVHTFPVPLEHAEDYDEDISN
jgi:hypothetical protein